MEALCNGARRAYIQRQSQSGGPRRNERRPPSTDTLYSAHRRAHRGGSVSSGVSLLKDAPYGAVPVEEAGTEGVHVQSRLDQIRACESLNGVVSCVAELSGRLEAEEASVALSRLAHFSTRPSPTGTDRDALVDVVNLLLAGATRERERPTARRVSTALWALARLVGSPALAAARVDAAEAAVRALCSQWQRGCQEGASFLDSSQVIWALGALCKQRLVTTLDPAFADGLLATLARQLAALRSTTYGREAAGAGDAATVHDEERCVTMAATGAAAAEPLLRGRPGHHALVAALAAHVEARAGAMAPRSLANCVRALVQGRYQTRLHRRALAALTAAVAGRLAADPEAFNLTERSMLVRACALAGLYPGNVINDVALQLTARAGELTFESATYTLWSMARFQRLMSPTALEGAGAAAADTAAAAPQSRSLLHGIAGALVSLAALGQLRAPGAQALAALARERLSAQRDKIPVDKIPVATLRALFHAHTLAHHAGAPLDLPPAVVDAGATLWAMRSRSTLPLSVTRCAHILAALDLPHRVAVAVYGGVLQVDVQVDAPGVKEPVAIMLVHGGDYIDRVTADGPSRDAVLAGSVAAEHAMLRDGGYRVAAMPRTAFAPYVRSTDLVAELAAALEGVGVRVGREAVDAAVARLGDPREVRDAFTRSRAPRRPRLAGSRELHEVYAATPDDAEAPSAGDVLRGGNVRGVDGGDGADIDPVAWEALQQARSRQDGSTGVHRERARTRSESGGGEARGGRRRGHEASPSSPVPNAADVHGAAAASDAATNRRVAPHSTRLPRGLRKSRRHSANDKELP